MELKANSDLQIVQDKYVSEDTYLEDKAKLLTKEDFIRDRIGTLYVIKKALLERVDEIGASGPIYRFFHKKELGHLCLMLDLIIQLDHKADKQLEML